MSRSVSVRWAIDKRDVDDAERRLERRVLVKLVDDDFRLGALLEIDDDPHAGAVRVVLHVGNVGDLPGLDDVGYPLDDRRLENLVWNLRDDDLRLSAAKLLGVHPRPDAHPPAPRAVALGNAVDRKSVV